ncbi:MAG: hypothetical protein CMH61_02010 [Nanoarchaeota archaeon]|nr:hypothetical protein [Nanoarchaeota archaeon]|tara:strand:+ start:767 stop:1285 length:519 start_codon:yes stop_codon:yes gene_type:complete
MNKRGVQLAINMIVVIIISLSIMALGFVLLNKFISNADEITVLLDQRTKDQLNNLLFNEGQQIALSRSTVKIKQDNEIMGIGILNIGNPGDPPANFTVNIGQPTGLQDESGARIIYDSSGFTLADQESKIIDVMVTADGADKGTYSSDITVYKAGSEYPDAGASYKLFIVVQ